jgi:ABC-type oligopeptide transport system substrate-binding subunit
MIGRRELLGIGSAALASCARYDGAYVGSTMRPRTARLVHTLAGEPDTLDPAKSSGGYEFYVIPAMFEGLTQYHPRLPKPMAALATHYEASPEQDQFTFYLRGHPAPRGIRLPDAGNLPTEFTRGQKSAPCGIAARWSDGTIITAQDFVYSWQRFLTPETAAPLAYQLYCVRNAEDVNTGKRNPHELGARALDDFTFQVDLSSSTPFFLGLITVYWFAAVPRQAIEAARQRGNESSWTEPQHMTVSGPFGLREWHRYESITAIRNPLYYEASMVGLDELRFMPVSDGTTAVNLYSSGAVATMPGFNFPPLFTTVLGRKKDFHSEPCFGTVAATINAQKPPLNNVLLRYALNMATEKGPFTDLLGGRRIPALTVVPPVPGYLPPKNLDVVVDGRRHDVLGFNIEAARALLVKEGFDPIMGRGNRTLELTYHIAALSDYKLRGEMLQQQWHRNLGIRVNLAVHEFSLHWKMVLEGNYRGAADYAFLMTYFDPNPYLDPFLTPGVGNPTGWTDPFYARMLADANRTLDSQERMAKLANCERHLLLAMPVVPLYFEALTYLQKPFVRGLTCNPFDIRAFKYAWIDTNWRST